MTAPSRHKKRRQRRYRYGRHAESAAAVFLMLHGYRILGRRWKTHLGEIDIVALRGGRVAFIEVKYRRSLAAAEASITPQLRRRVRRSADLWLAKHSRFHNHDIGFDVLFLRPWHWPCHIENGL